MIVIVMIVMVPVIVLSVDDHLVVAAVLLVMRMIGLSVNPAARRREDKISNQEHVL